MTARDDLYDAAYALINDERVEANLKECVIIWEALFAALEADGYTVARLERVLDHMNSGWKDDPRGPVTYDDDGEELRPLVISRLVAPAYLYRIPSLPLAVGVREPPE